MGGGDGRVMGVVGGAIEVGLCEGGGVRVQALLWGVCSHASPVLSIVACYLCCLGE